MDECASGLHKCHLNADCEDTEGSYTCTCKEGNAGDGITCEGMCVCVSAFLHVVYVSV